jgi:tripartite-type tricarboxylate transporter receptor subunit TctC
MIKWMKDTGPRVKVAHPGVGSFGHLAGVLVAQELGVEVTQVPYRGAGPAMTDLLGSQVDMMSQSAVAAAGLVKAGKLKGYAIVGRTRFPGLPDLPTIGELGYKKLELDFWHMLLVPTGTPRPIIDRLNAALRTAMDDPNVKKAFDEGGMQRFPAAEETPEGASDLLKREIKLWGEVIRANNFTVPQ